MLTEEKIPSPAGKEKWHASTVRRVLSNETYMGDKLLQKTYSVDFLHRKRLSNRGQVQQYYVEGDHEPIIPPKTFQLVQEEIERRRNRPASGGTIFSGKLLCAQCGAVYGRKIRHSTSKTAGKEVWQCNGKYAHANGRAPGKWKELTGGTEDCSGKNCASPTLQEQDIRRAFEQLLRSLDGNQTETIASLYELLRLMDNAGTEVENRADNNRKMDGAFPSNREGMGQAGARKKAVLNFISRRKGEAEFSEELWCFMVDYVLVYQDRLRFVLASGEQADAAL
jgi:hypothetical protein